MLNKQCNNFSSQGNAVGEDKYYFTVEALNAAKEGGASLVVGPQEVPGGQWIAQYFAPQGAMFAMVSYTR